ncbi:GPP34 family phosphoprotein [Plantactinospora sp. GCM10030261]|uniref:GOLPH3/VPS74 family protein n=1 Tax=Plantactinospora sp. GCM10030261 TaxID=3273420 RepID=UPI0036178E32
MTEFRLADELFLIGHDEYTGKTRVNEELLATGLAGAVLGELLINRRISCLGGKVSVVDQRPWGETVSDAALGELQRRMGSYVVRAWVEHLRDNAREAVGRRLVNAGVVRREESRGMLGRRNGVRFPGVEPMVCAQPQVKLAYQLERPGVIHPQMATLAALLLAVGLEHLLVVTMSRQECKEQLSQITASLPEELHTLVTGVQAATAALALTVRR